MNKLAKHTLKEIVIANTDTGHFESKNLSLELIIKSKVHQRGSIGLTILKT
jgi:hypothetical protein